MTKNKDLQNFFQILQKNLDEQNQYEETTFAKLNKLQKVNKDFENYLI